MTKLFITMTTSTVSSIIFTTASGRPVEVSSAQMEMARNRLWRSDVSPAESQVKTAGPSQSKTSPTADKENDYNFFDDDFDDDFDLFMETYVPVCSASCRSCEQFLMCLFFHRALLLHPNEFYKKLLQIVTRSKRLVINTGIYYHFLDLSVKS